MPALPSTSTTPSAATRESGQRVPDRCRFVIGSSQALPCEIHVPSPILHTPLEVQFERLEMHGELHGPSHQTHRGGSPPLPDGFLATIEKGQCAVCSRIISTRTGPSCRKCRKTHMQATGSAQAKRARTTPHIIQALAPPGLAHPAASLFPSIEAIFTKCGGIKKAVPQGARDIWARCLTTALRQVARNSSEDDWKALLCLPACCLAVTTRGGGRGGKSKPLGSSGRDAKPGWRAMPWTCGEKPKGTGPPARESQRTGPPKRLNGPCSKWSKRRCRKASWERGALPLRGPPPG